MLPREAAQVLECSEETVKNRIRSGCLEGRHFTNDRGENRNYAESVAVREASRERRELARVGNVAEEGEVVRENSRDLAGLILEAVKRNRETVGGEVSRRRVEVLEKLGAMPSERQGQFEELMGMVRLLLEDQQGVKSPPCPSTAFLAKMWDHRARHDGPERRETSSGSDGLDPFTSLSSPLV